MQNRKTLHTRKVLIADVEHNVGVKGSTPGAEWPVQLTHGSFLDIKDDIDDTKMAISFEHLAAMGFNMYPPEDSLLPQSGLVEALGGGTFSRREIKMMAGNSMHVVTQAAWMCYVLSNIVRCPEPTVARALTRRQQTFDCLEDEEEDVE